MSQISKIKMVSDPAWLEEAFLLRTTRKVNHDATIQMEKVLYETDQRLAGIRVEVRYDPSWLLNSSQPLQLYVDGKKAGEAKCVNFKDNAYVRRKRGNGPEPKDERGEDSKKHLSH
jgi:putative transposase